MDNRFIILTEYYKSKKKARYKEIFRSIAANCKNPNIKKVVLFMPPNAALPHELNPSSTSYPPEYAFNRKISSPPNLTHEEFSKIHLHNMNKRRSRYSDFFLYANQNLEGERCVLCNNDISFDETLFLPDNFDLSAHFICLTRWDIQKGDRLSFFRPARVRKSSQDAWIFTPKLPDKMIEKGKFYMGKPGCDGMVSYLATISGLKIMNPSEAIKARHYHMSRYRTYSRRDRMGGDAIYMHVYPHNLVEYVEDKVMYRTKPVGRATGKEAIDRAVRMESANEDGWLAALRKCGK